MKIRHKEVSETSPHLASTIDDAEYGSPYFVRIALKTFWFEDTHVRQQYLMRIIVEDEDFVAWCQRGQFVDLWAREALALAIVQRTWKSLSKGIYGTESISERSQIANANKIIQNMVEQGEWREMIGLAVTPIPPPATPTAHPPGWWLALDGNWYPPRDQA